MNVPQNEAWLSLIRNAAKSVFIQTPDLNAPPLIPAIGAALKRGVEVTIYVCFGYNDAGEMIPGQGGTNEQAAKSLIDSLPIDGPERGYYISTIMWVKIKNALFISRRELAHVTLSS